MVLLQGNGAGVAVEQDGLAVFYEAGGIFYVGRSGQPIFPGHYRGVGKQTPEICDNASDGNKDRRPAGVCVVGN